MAAVQVADALSMAGSKLSYLVMVLCSEVADHEGYVGGFDDCEVEGPRKSIHKAPESQLGIVGIDTKGVAVGFAEVNVNWWHGIL
jgi:hypothetical protein